MWSRVVWGLRDSVSVLNAGIQVYINVWDIKTRICPHLAWGFILCDRGVSPNELNKFQCQHLGIFLSYFPFSLTGMHIQLYSSFCVVNCCLALLRSCLVELDRNFLTILIRVSLGNSLILPVGTAPPCLTKIKYSVSQAGFRGQTTWLQTSKHSLGKWETQAEVAAPVIYHLDQVEQLHWKEKETCNSYQFCGQHPQLGREREVYTQPDSGSPTFQVSVLIPWILSFLVSFSHFFTTPLWKAPFYPVAKWETFWNLKNSQQMGKPRLFHLHSWTPDQGYVSVADELTHFLSSPSHSSTMIN